MKRPAPRKPSKGAAELIEIRPARLMLPFILASLLAGCSPPSVIRTTPATPSPPTNTNGALAEPGANEVVIVINNNAPSGNHG